MPVAWAGYYYYYFFLKRSWLGFYNIIMPSIIHRLRGMVSLQNCAVGLQYWRRVHRVRFSSPQNYFPTTIPQFLVRNTPITFKLSLKTVKSNSSFQQGMQICMIALMLQAYTFHIYINVYRAAHSKCMFMVDITAIWFSSLDFLVYRPQ